MSNPPPTKQTRVLIWILGGIIAGTCLGIIAAFIIVALNFTYGEFPNGLPGWDWIKVIFELEAFRLGAIGAVIGGSVGFFIWSFKNEHLTLNTHGDEGDSEL